MIKNADTVTQYAPLTSGKHKLELI